MVRSSFPQNGGGPGRREATRPNLEQLKGKKTWSMNRAPSGEMGPAPVPGRVKPAALEETQQQHSKRYPASFVY